MAKRPRGPRSAILLGTVLLVAACSSGGLQASRDSPYAPGIRPGASAENGLLVGHRLMEAGEFELALTAFTRAAVSEGLTVDILSALGSANLGLGRLGQAETLLRRAIETDEAIPQTWNNLGVVLMEKGETAEAEQIFRRAYALDNGESDSIRDNLRLALAKTQQIDYDPVQQDYKMVRRGSSDYLLRRIN